MCVYIGERDTHTQRKCACERFGLLEEGPSKYASSMYDSFI